VHDDDRLIGKGRDVAEHKTNGSGVTSTLDAAAVAAYQRAGFYVLDRLVDDDALAELRAAYDEVLHDTDAGGAKYLLGGVTKQVMMPSLLHPVFAHNRAVEAGMALVADLLDDPVLSFDMLIYKPPSHPHETPWHQDMAYCDTPFAAAGTPIPLQKIQFWVALDDVDAENGCMHFVPGLHTQPLLAHLVASGDPHDDRRLLALTDPESQLDLSQAVAAPLRAGGATMHAYGTPHYTSPNRSVDRPRRAYIFNLSARAVAAETAARIAAAR
jgi:ectoine hydroxylase-related dioxygenase (phytanoyl-CoA dioxygenase family)